MDISKKNSSQLNTSFAETEEGQWVAANAHRFGFIVRYLKEYEDVTGYMYEPWHVRYVGKEQARPSMIRRSHGNLHDRLQAGRV